MRRGTLIVMVKEPRAGRVKSRLGREIGMTAAAWWFRHQVRALLRRVSDPRWRVVLAVAPDRAVLSRALPVQFVRWAQGRGDLGARMARMMAQAGGPVCVIGADVPGITRGHLSAAFAALGDHDAVIGPSEDGGFWLIGVRGAVPAGLFENVRWSTPDAMVDTVASLGGARIARIATLRDVDVAADLR